MEVWNSTQWTPVVGEHSKGKKTHKEYNENIKSGRLGSPVRLETASLTPCFWPKRLCSRQLSQIRRVPVARKLATLVRATFPVKPALPSLPDTWVTPREQSGDMLCSSSVVVLFSCYTSPKWNSAQRNSNTLMWNRNCHQRLRQHCGE